MLLYVATSLTILNEGKNVGVHCSDGRGAFGRVCAKSLLDKLASLGRHRDLFSFVKSCLRDRQAFVVVVRESCAGPVLVIMVYQGAAF